MLQNGKKMVILDLKPKIMDTSIFVVAAFTKQVMSEIMGHREDPGKGPVNSSKALGATGSVGVEGLRLEV